MLAGKIGRLGDAKRVKRSTILVEMKPARFLPLLAAAQPPIRPAPIKVRTLFISDVHLGARASQAEAVLAFLSLHDADTIYLVGDIIDGWALQSSWHWPETHNQVIQLLLQKASAGARIVYLPGNHDEFLRSYHGTHFGGIEVKDTDVHVTAAGKRYLVLHGDTLDFIIFHAGWLAHLGDKAYRLALLANRAATAVRRRLGLPYWSLSAWAKMKVKNAVNVISRFEDALRAEALRHEADGVICGHIHCAASRDMDGVHYLNTGDWVESLTALVEHPDGELEIIRWTEREAELRGRAEAQLGGSEQVGASEHAA
jgi:UDP-2,3-diacylglucosamine pyrophosphatase LpxH